MKNETPNEPLISVCIANYNGRNIIDDCIQSILSQTGGHAVEILIHDDASTDDSAAYIRSHYPDVILIESQGNVGYCVSNNRLVARASGDYILLLNNDAALFPDALSTLLEHARSLGSPAILGLPQYDWESGALHDRGALVDPFLNAVPNMDPKRHDVALIAGACLWIDKTLWNDLGGFPEWFGSIAEDLYLCCQARLAGHPVRVLGTSGYRHRVGQSFGGGKVAARRLVTTFRRRALSERNKTFVMAITYPTPFMQLALLTHLPLLLLEGIALSLLKLDSRYLREIYLPVFGELIQHGKVWSAARRLTQEKKSISNSKFFRVFDWQPYKIRMLARHGFPTLK